MKRQPRYALATLLILSTLLIVGCLPPDLVSGQAAPESPISQPDIQPNPVITPLPTRPTYGPGELVDYIAQTGDTLPAIASHFNTTEAEIRAANTFIPQDATTMPPGMPMKIPIYYQALWGSPYQIIPDSHFINGPALIGFDTQAFVDSQPGWLKHYRDYVADSNRTGAQIVDYVATNYSVSPRLLLAILEYQLGALTQEQPSVDLSEAPLGEPGVSYRGLYRQLAWAANVLNNGYYRWRDGDLKEINLPGGKLERPDPWQNAASVALHHYFSLHLTPDEFNFSVSQEGFAATYTALFGDPWSTSPHIPGSLQQPNFRLPFEAGKTWAYTGGPHNPWGEGMPLAALDFAPPSVVGGCSDTEEWATAVADGIISRTGPGIAVLDTDGDGDERTGWVLFYLHLASKDLIPASSQVIAGQPLGHPSCEGGRATGTHVHIARKYNGEWILAGGVLAFNLEGWIARNGREAYQGTLQRQGRSIIACVCSDQSSHIRSEQR